MSRVVVPCAAIALALVLPGLAERMPPVPIDTPGFTQADFFSTDRVWTTHLTFTADQWNAMQPRSGPGGYGGFGFGGGFQGPEGARNGVAARQGVEFDYVHADLSLDGRRFPDVAVRYKGNGTFMQGRQWGKISLKVDLNKYKKGQKLAGVSTINFENDITDIGWMNEVLAYRLYRDAGVPAPRSSYAKVYVTAQGSFTDKYFGLYSISENLDTNFTEDRFGTKLGAIVKPSTGSPFTDLGDDWARYNQTYDPKTDLTDAEKARLIEFCKFVSHASDEEFTRRIGEYLDLDEFARYFAVLVWLANPDSLLQMGQNYYVYLNPETHKLMFFPWDQDWSFGNGRGMTTNWSIAYPWSGSNTLLGRVYSVEAFRTAYFARMREFNQTIFNPDRFATQIAGIAPVIRPAIQDEGAQWLSGFDSVASGAAGIVPFARARAQAVAAQLAQQ